MLVSSVQTASSVATIETHGLARRFGAKWVLRGISLTVRAGESVGLLGSNGSGKTTLLRILSTLLRPSAGDATVCGSGLLAAPDAVRSQVGFFAHAPGLYEDLTARENLRFAAGMLGIPETGIDALLERVGLSAVADHRTRGFSSGMQRRLALARLLMGSPRLLLLDEPFNNLDADGIGLMRDVLRETVERGGSALVVVHDPGTAAGLLHRTVRLVDGRIADDGADTRTSAPRNVDRGPMLPSGATGVA